MSTSMADRLERLYLAAERAGRAAEATREVEGLRRRNEEMARTIARQAAQIERLLGEFDRLDARMAPAFVDMAVDVVVPLAVRVAVDGKGHVHPSVRLAR